MLFKAKLADGKEVEVDIDAVPAADVAANYVPKAHHDAEFTKLRKKSEGLFAPEALLKDDEFKGKALQTWGVDPKGRPSPEELNRVREQVLKTEVEPLKQQLEKLSSKVQTARKRDLHYQLTQAAAAMGVKKALLTPPENLPNAPAPFVNMIEAYFGHDDERDAWFVKNGETFAFASKPTNDSPYKGPSEFVSEFVKQQPGFLEDQRQRGAGVQSPGGGQGGGSVARVKAGDPLSFGSSLEAIRDGKAVFEE